MTSQIVNGRVENYRYDDAGNLLQDAKNTYEYDAFRRTSMVTTKAGDVQINRYVAEGLRYEMEENGKLVQFIFNENKEVIAEQKEDIDGLTPKQIQDKFALPQQPIYACDVEIPKGEVLRVGKVNPIDGWGEGGGIQFDVIGKRMGDFKNERKL